MAAKVTTGSGVWSSTTIDAPWSDATPPTAGDTVTINNTHRVALDLDVEVGADTATPAIQIAAGGVLEVLHSAAGNYALTCKGDFKNAGTIEFGTVADPIHSDRTLRILTNYSASLADGKYGFIQQAGATCIMQGPSKTYDRALLNANNGGTCSTAGTAVTALEGTSFVGKTGTMSINGSTYTIASVGDATHLTLTGTAGTQTAVSFVFHSDNLTLTTDVSTGWADNDVIGIATTDRTYTHCEKAVLNGAASGTTLTIDGAAGNAGGLKYGHMGTSPIQAEIINLTRNIAITAYNTSYPGYVTFETTATVDIDWVEFSYLGNNNTDKHGLTVKTTSGSLSIRHCALHDFTDSGFTSIGATNNNWEFSDNVAYGLTATAGSGWITLTGTSGTSITLNNDIVMAIATSNCRGISLADCRGTATNLTCVGSQTYAIVGSAYPTTVISGWVSHGNGGDGMQISGATTGLTATTLTDWRNAGTGVVLVANNPGQGVAAAVVTDIVSFGNAVRSLYCDACYEVTLNNPILSGDTVFATPLGLSFQASRTTIFTVVGGSFGLASGIKTTHSSADIDLNNLQGAVILDGTSLNSGTSILNQTGIGLQSWLAIQSSAVKKRYYRYGTISLDSAIYDAATPSERLTPNNASNKLESGPKRFTVDSGGTKTITVKVRYSKSTDTSGFNYAGNPPRLVLKANVAAGIASDTVLATHSGAADWVTVSGATTPAVTDDAVLEVVVDCDGNSGAWINVDDWSIS